MQTRGKTLSIGGFSLIEVLVSLVVISVGLLGVAKMHALAIGNTRVSGARALAAIYAGSISSAMHANTMYWQTPTVVTASVTTSLNSDKTAVVLSDTTLNGQTGSCVWSASNTAPSCEPAQMAAYDLRTWGMSLKQLPNGNGNVACSGAAVVSCTITISWTEKFIAANASQVNSAAQQPTAQQTFVAVVQP